MRRIKTFLNKYKFVLITFFIFFVPRIIGLGWDVWNVDAQRWQVRSDEFVKAIEKGDFVETYQSYHPGVIVMWLSGFSKAIFYKLFELAYGYKVTVATGYVYPEKFSIVSFFAKAPLVLLISTLLTFSLILLRRLKFEEKYLYLYAILLSLEPYYLGVTRFLHLTGLESAFTFASVTTCYYALSSKTPQKNFYLYLSAFLVGLGILTKMSVVIVLPFICLLIFYYSFDLKNYAKSMRSLIIKYPIYLLIIIATFTILFPYVWVKGPFHAYLKMKDTGIDHIAFMDGPHRSILKNKYLYYYEIFAVKSLGLTVISFFVGIYFFFKLKLEEKGFYSFILISGLYIVYYFFIMAFPSKQMTRYTVIAYPFLMLISTYGLYKFLELFKSKLKYYILAVIGVYYMIVLYAYYPNYSTFHSDLIGGQLGYSKLGKVYNDGEYYLQVSQYLNETGGKEAYDYALVVDDNKDMSAGYAFYGQAFTKSVKGDKKYKNIFYAVEYSALETKPENCEFVRTFGPRTPFKFDFLYLYKCAGN